MLELCTTAIRPECGLYLGPERRSRPAAPMAHWLARMLDEMDHGMLLVTPTGAVRHANQPARQELARGGSLRLLDGQVQASQTSERNVFSSALADAKRGKRRLLSLGHNGDALSIALVPMGAEGGDAEPLVLLVLGKRQSCETLTVDFFARTQGLTSAESRVLQVLCDGLRPKEAAREFGVAVSTIRTQISSIRTKTQTASIRDLVNRVTTLPPITLAMKSVLSH
ncbi:MAG TPA: LuxR C-terminal-related transcriptional regulator [Rhizobacter sp.]|nr:LuxR C-terminal-related transcriptional regulator [Rhizobacter sp.]